MRAFVIFALGVLAGKILYGRIEQKRAHETELDELERMRAHTKELECELHRLKEEREFRYFETRLHSGPTYLH